MAVSRYRYLTTSNILSIVSGSRQNITRRLQRLYHAGYLDRPRAQLPLRFAGEFSEFVYARTRKGSVAASGERTVSRKECKPVSSLFLSHALSVSGSLIAIEAACRSQGIAYIPEQQIIGQADKTRHFQWRTSIQAGTKMESVGVIPDAAFAIEREEESNRVRRLYFFLESDRGTMPLYRRSLRLSSIRRKALAYSQSRRSRVLKERLGIPGFQVLFLTGSNERSKRMKEVCEAEMQGRATSLFLFAAYDELKNGDRSILSLLGITNTDDLG